MDYPTLKFVHILSATLLFGTGLGSAFYLWFTYLSGDIAALRTVSRLVVVADFLFTTPAAIVQPLTGWMLYRLLGMPEAWLWLVLALYGLMGLCWIPVVFIQIRVRNLAASAERVEPEIRRLMWRWFWLGVPAFSAALGIYFLMVFKPALGGLG